MIDLFWIEGPGPGRIGVMPRPDGGADLEGDSFDLRGGGVDLVVSLLERSEVDACDLQREGELCVARGMEFRSFPIPDHTAPRDLEPAAAFARDLAACYRRGHRIMIHCLAGIGRSPTIAGAILLELGLPLPEVLRRMAEARGYPVPEAAEQRAWLQRYFMTKQPG